MPTNDERREVAARLREQDIIDMVTLSQCWLPKMFEVSCKDFALSCGACSEYVLNRLADLIEPEPERTCRIEYVKHGPFFDVLRFSCCGYEWAENRTDPGATEPDPNFCPNCGARVKEGE